jgi:hypothetical protein
VFPVFLAILLIPHLCIVVLGTTPIDLPESEVNRAWHAPHPEGRATELYCQIPFNGRVAMLVVLLIAILLWELWIIDEAAYNQSVPR